MDKLEQNRIRENSRKQNSKNKKLSSAEWERELISRTVERIIRRYEANPKFITHLCLAFINVDDNAIETVSVDDLPVDAVERKCALTNKEFDSKVAPLKSKYSSVLLSEIALKALNEWFNLYGCCDEHIIKSMINRRQNFDKTGKTKQQRKSTMADCLSDDTISMLNELKSTLK